MRRFTSYFRALFCKAAMLSTVVEANHAQADNMAKGYYNNYSYNP